MKKIERDNRQRGSETIGIEIERWGMDCADKDPRSSLIVEKSSRKQKRQSRLSQHSSAVPERIHPGETKNSTFNETPHLKQQNRRLGTSRTTPPSPVPTKQKTTPFPSQQPNRPHSPQCAHKPLPPPPPPKSTQQETSDGPSDRAKPPRASCKAGTANGCPV